MAFCCELGVRIRQEVNLRLIIVRKKMSSIISEKPKIKVPKKKLAKYKKLFTKKTGYKKSMTISK